jgi:hemerythrin superfamily protein
MSILDKAIAAITPTEKPEERAQARTRAYELARTSPWLGRVLDQHREIESAFEAVAAATHADSRRLAQKRLAVLLTGHSLAEEAVLYPAMALGDQKAHATIALTEHSGVKVNLAALETLDPMSQDYLDKLEHVKNAVTHHVYEEESTWYPELARDTPPGDQMRLDMRFAEEFERYMGADAAA